MDYSQLLIDVQKKASVSVQSVRDLKLLKEEIEVKSLKRGNCAIASAKDYMYQVCII